MRNQSESSWILRFSDDVVSCKAEGERVTVEIRDWRSLPLRPTRPGVAEALQRLQAPGSDLAGLTSDLDEDGRNELSYFLNRLERIRTLEWAVIEQGEEIASLQSLSATFHLDYETQIAPETIALSRFAYLRRVPAVQEGAADQAVLESGGSRVRMTLAPRAAELLAVLAAEPQPLGAHALYELALRSALAEPLQGEEAEERMPWEFHDRLFHEVTRGCRETDPWGGTYRMKGVIPSPPAVVALPGEQLIALPPAQQHASLPLDQVLAKRRSIRSYADEPIDLQQLSDLLFRVARTTGRVEADPQSIITRPYPSGGSIHELQFYLAVWNCKDLERGLYRYVGETHSLLPVGGSNQQMERLVSLSGAAMGQTDGKPQVLLILTTRHPRMAWKYQAMAYRATLMNVGVVFQTLYLVATDLGLAACANGSGDSRVFEEASGLNSWEESAIGEFALGRAA